MRQVKNIVFIVTVALAVTVLASGVNARQQDLDRVVPGGGITGAGWQGNVIDANALKTQIDVIVKMRAHFALQAYIN